MTFSRIAGCPLKISLILAIVVIAEASRTSRVVGGSNARIDEFPWQAALLENNNFTCGAAIISSRHVVTAAHCVSVNSTRVLPNTVSVVVGSGELFTQIAEVHGVKSIEIHSGFEEFYPYLHDIALLTLVNDIQFDLTKRPIELPKTNVPVNAIAKFSGWGLSVVGEFAKYLKKLEFKIMSNTDCDKSKLNTSDYDYDDPKYREPLISGQVCGLPGPDSGACEGDSGGALVYKNTLAGIFSWKYGCGKGYPNIFTRVYEYVDWIRDKMAQT